MIVIKLKPITSKRLGQLTKQRTLKKYQDWRDAVLARDNNTCQYPGCNKTEKLQVHHIKKFSIYKHLRTETFNGISLCVLCHSKVTGNESRYEEIFFQIVKENMAKQKMDLKNKYGKSS